MVFAVSSRYGEPPLSVTQGGGIFNTRLLPRDSAEFAATPGMAAELFRAFGLPRGVTHTEFIRAHDDGQFYFLETAACPATSGPTCRPTTTPKSSGACRGPTTPGCWWPRPTRRGWPRCWSSTPSASPATS